MTMLAALLSLMLGIPDCVPACPLAEGWQSINLGVGTQRVVKVPDVEKVTVEGESAEIKPIGSNQFLVIGNMSGVSRIRFTTLKGVIPYRVSVKNLDPDSCGWFKPSVYDMLPCESGFDVLMKDGQMVVIGTYRSVDDWQKVSAIPRRWVTAKIPPPTKAIVDKVIRDANGLLRDAGLRIRVHRIGKGFVLSKAFEAETAKAAEVLAAQMQLLRDTTAAAE